MSGGIAQSGQPLNAMPAWTVAPHETDWMAWVAVVSIALSVYFIFFLYAKFDEWAEHKAKATPLAKTIPTLLGIALLYEIFPLDHFSILLPLSAILIALMSDWRREQDKKQDINDILAMINHENLTTDVEIETADQTSESIQQSTKSESIDSTGSEPEAKRDTNV